MYFLYEYKWNTQKIHKTLKTNKPGENEPITIPEKEIENVQHLLSEKETEIEKLDDSKTVNENKIADMKHEIENLKKREASSTKPNQSQERRNMRNTRLLSNMRKKTAITN